VGASEMLKTARYQLPATEWPENHFHLRISTFLAVLKWMWHLALEAGKVFQTASMLTAFWSLYEFKSLFTFYLQSSILDFTKTR
jgi:hypothetical protein